MKTKSEQVLNFLCIKALLFFLLFSNCKFEENNTDANNKWYKVLRINLWCRQQTNYVSESKTEAFKVIYIVE